MKALICIPTYNESEHIVHIINAIRRTEAPFHILIIDDNSPDGTGDLVQDQMRYHENLHLIRRTKKKGIGSAYREGFAYGLAHKFDFIGQMDADFSHPPRSLIEVYRLLTGEQRDYLIGSRFIQGGKILNWSPWQAWASNFVNKIIRSLLQLPIQDMTSGFNFWRRDVLMASQVESLNSEGYAFQIELKNNCHNQSQNFAEFPILFEERRIGHTKLNKWSVLMALFKVIHLLWKGRSRS